MKKVKLGYYSEDDLQFIHELLSDSEVVAHFPYLYTTSIEQSDLRLKMRLLDRESSYANRFLIRDFFSGERVGEISGRVANDNASIMELAIIIHPAFRGKGYAKAATIKFTRYILKHKREITRLRMEIADGNSPSFAVAKSLDFDFARLKGDDMQFWEKDIR